MSGLDGLYLKALQNWINYVWSLCNLSYALCPKRSLSTIILFFLTKCAHRHSGLSGCGSEPSKKPLLGNWYMLYNRRYSLSWMIFPSRVESGRSFDGKYTTHVHSRPSTFTSNSNLQMKARQTCVMGNNPTYSNMFVSARDWRTANRSVC